MIHSMNLFVEAIREIGDNVTIPGGAMPEWLSTRYAPQQNRTLQSVFVVADSSVQMRIYKNNAAAPTYTISIPSGGKEVYLPSPTPNGWLRFDFNGDDHLVREVSLFQDAPIQATSSPLQFSYPFRKRRVNFADPCRLMCFVLEGTSDLAATVTVGGETIAATGDGVVNEITNQTAGLEVEVDIEVTAGAISSATFFPERFVDFSDGIRISNGGDIPEWRYTTYRMVPRNRIRSARVTGGAAQLDFYFDGSGTAATMSPTNQEEVAFAEKQPMCDSFRLKVTGDVDTVDVAAERTVLDGQGAGPFVRNIKLVFPEPATPGIAAVLADDYDGLTMKFNCEGMLTPVSVNVLDSNRFLLPTTLPRSNEWDLEILSGSFVYMWYVQERTVVAQSGPIAVTQRNGEVSKVGSVEYTFADKTRIRSLRVLAQSYTIDEAPITIDVYVDGTKHVIEVADGDEFVLETTLEGKQFVLWADPDLEIDSIALFPEEIVPVDNAGLVVRNASDMQGWRCKTLQFPDRGSISVVRVDATAPVSLTIGGVLVGDGDPKQILDNNDVRIAGVPNAHTLDLDVQCSGKVNEIVLFGERTHDVQEHHVRIVRDMEPFTWIDHAIRSSIPVNFSCARVDATAYPVTFRLRYGDTVFEKSVSSKSAFRLPRHAPEREHRVDVIAPSGARVEAVSVATSMERLLA